MLREMEMLGLHLLMVEKEIKRLKEWSFWNEYSKSPGDYVLQ